MSFANKLFSRIPFFLLIVSFTIKSLFILCRSICLFFFSGLPLPEESESRSVVSDSLRPHRQYSPWSSPGQNTGGSSLSLLQGIFPTQGSNPSLLHCRRILYQLIHKVSPRILEWVAYSFSSGSSRPRN